MAFDPDAFLSQQGQQFDPDAFLASASQAPTQAPAASPASSDRIGGPWGSVLDYFNLQKQAQAPEQQSVGAKALEAAGRTVNQFVPRSAEAAASLATPAVQGIEDLYNAPSNIQQAYQNRNLPGQGPIYEAEQTPPYSQERFNVGADIVGQMLMAKGLAGQIGAHAAAPNVDAAVRESMAQPPPTVSLGPGTTAADVMRAMERRFTMAPDVPEGTPQMQTAPDLDAILKSLESKRFGKITAEGEIPQQPSNERVPAETAKFGPEAAPKAETAPPAAEAANVPPVEPQQGTVRLYHGGQAEAGQAGSDFTTSKEYAQAYADKGTNGKVWYVDVPEGTLKTHDEYGQPMTRVVVPDEIANQAQPLQPETAASTIQTPDELSSSQAQAGQRDTALRAEPEPAAVGGAGAAEGAEGGRGAAAGTSIKNSYTDALREKYGLAPAVQEARKSLGQSLVEAQSAESREPGTARRLVDDINSGRVKAIDDKGDGLLTIETIDAQVERSSAEDAVNNAKTPDELDIAKSRLEAAKDRQQAAYDADKLSGTHLGRGLNARQMAAKNDYSPTRMQGAARAAQNGKPLSDRQSAYVQDLQKRIETLEKQSSQYSTGKSRPRAERMRIKSDAVTARKGGKSLGDFLSEKADAARERIKQMKDVGVDCI